MTVGPPPTEWKTANWWRNRSTEERLAWAHIPNRWASISFDQWSSSLSDFIDGFNTSVPGLLIVGPSGSGKTTLAITVLRRLIMTYPLSGRFVNSDRWIEMLKDQFDNDNQLPEMYAMPHLVKYIKGVFDVVVLDGLGQERLTEFAQHEIGSLLRQRWEECRPTIITTSLTRIDVVRRYGDRISGVMNDMVMLSLPSLKWSK